MYQSQAPPYSYPHNYYPTGAYDAAWSQYYASQASGAYAQPASATPQTAPSQPPNGAACEPPVPGAEPPAPPGNSQPPAPPPTDSSAPPLPPTEAQYNPYQATQGAAYDANTWHQYQQQHYQYYGQYPQQPSSTQDSWMEAAPAMRAAAPPPGAPPAATAAAAWPAPAQQAAAATQPSPVAATHTFASMKSAASAAKPTLTSRSNALPSKAEIQAQIAAAASAAAARVGRAVLKPVTSSKPSQVNGSNGPAAAKAMAAAQALSTKLTGSKVNGKTAQPAFVKVGQGAVAAATSAGGKAAQAGEHPPALRNFVMRLFARGQVTEAEKEALRKLIADAKEKGELWTRDWDRTPLPTTSNTTAIAATKTTVSASKWGPTAKPIAATKSALPGPPARPEASSPPAALAKQPSPSKQAKKSQYKRPRAPSPSSSDDSDQAAHVDSREEERRKKRAGRFGDGMAMDHKGNKLTKKMARTKAKAGLTYIRPRSVPVVTVMDDEPEEINWDKLIVKGTCKDIEKSYFRLTSAPDPSTVRPEPVLRRAYERLVTLLALGQKNYFYALDQFKGQRQDLTVQHIKNDLTVLVYEGHARAALEYGDAAEFNQCQTQLDVLYRQGVRGCRHEFLAYRLLYLAVHMRQGQGPALLSTLKNLAKEDFLVPEVKHALQVRAAVARYDYVRFFQLYACAPNLGRCVMDVYVSAMRRRAADAITCAVRPSVPVPELASVLGFLSSLRGNAASHGQGSEVLPGCVRPAGECGKHVGEEDEEDAWDSCVAWLIASNAVVTGPSPGTMLDCKASLGNIVTPQDTTAVAHGDANLAIDDFLARAL